MYVMNEYLSHLFNASSINENQIDCRCRRLHHQANLEMGHLLTHSCLKHPEVSLMVFCKSYWQVSPNGWYVERLTDGVIMDVILKTVVSPKDASSLLLKCCVFCFILSDDGKSSNTYQRSFAYYNIIKELHGKINPLKTKRRLLYLKTQSVPRCKHFTSRL